MNGDVGAVIEDFFTETMQLRGLLHLIAREPRGQGDGQGCWAMVVGRPVVTRTRQHVGLDTKIPSFLERLP